MSDRFSEKNPQLLTFSKFSLVDLSLCEVWQRYSTGITKGGEKISNHLVLNFIFSSKFMFEANCPFECENMLT